MKASTKRRRRSTEEVRALIVCAARDLFRARGYEATTTRDISIKAKVSETLVFSNFGDKPRLFDAAVVEPFLDFAAKYVASWTNQDPNLGPEARVEGFVRGLFELAEENRAVLLSSAMRRLSAGQVESDNVVDHLAQAIQSMSAIRTDAPYVRDFNRDFNVENATATVGAAASMVFGVVLLGDLVFSQDNPRPHREALIAEVAKTILHGVLHRQPRPGSKVRRPKGRRGVSR